MKITLQNVGKRYNREWIFRGIDFTFSSDKSYAITGHNGSGKSTLLQVIAGSVMKTEGTISYENTSSKIPEEKIFTHLSIAAPYLELIEEMTANEFLNFHQTFKKLSSSNKEILERVGLKKAVNKQIRYFSSGMKQRLKLAQAFYSEAPVLLLDEPTTNLDAEGISLYKIFITEFRPQKLIIVCSNDPNEFDFCDERLGVEGFKGLKVGKFKG